MDNENKWEYDYSSEHSQTGETGYPNVGSSGMNTANTAGTYGEAAQMAPQAEPNGGSDGGAVPPPEGPRYQAAQGSPKQPPKKRRRKNGNIARSAVALVLAAAMGFCLRQFAPEKPGAGMLLVGAAAAAALGSIQLWQLLPGVIVCAALELYLCSKGQAKAALAACAVLGGVLGAARAVLPTRGRAAFLPDMLFVGVALMALQSYAVSQSQAGQLRGYMALAAFCAAGAVQAALRPLFAAAEAFAGKLLLGPVRLAARCIAPWKAARAAAKVRRNEKRLAKKQKKSLPTPRRMLYNSNVSK